MVECYWMLRPFIIADLHCRMTSPWIVLSYLFIIMGPCLFRICDSYGRLMVFSYMLYLQRNIKMSRNMRISLIRENKSWSGIMVPIECIMQRAHCSSPHCDWCCGPLCDTCTLGVRFQHYNVFHFGCIINAETICMVSSLTYSAWGPFYPFTYMD